MAKSSIVVLALLLSLASGFIPRQPALVPKQPTTTTSELQAAPTMSAIDYVGYAAGQTDEWKGTGVWSGLSTKRDDGDGDDKPPPDDKKAPKSS